MCGRYSITANPEAIERRFGARFEKHFLPQFNAPPSTQLPIIRYLERSVIALGTRGFIPENWQWFGKSPVRPQNNARIETAQTKPMFREAFEHRRCLVLADGFFEWKTEGTTKQPYRFTLKSGEFFAMAGLFSHPDPHDLGKLTFAILTTEANACMAPIHHRMPVILKPGAEQSWLSSGANSFIPPFPAELMQRYPVTPKMNKASFNEPEAIAPLPQKA